MQGFRWLCGRNPPAAAPGGDVPKPRPCSRAPLLFFPLGLVLLVNTSLQPAPAGTKLTVIPLSFCRFSLEKPRQQCLVCPSQCHGGHVPEPARSKSGGAPDPRGVSLQTEIAAVQSIGVPADKIFYSSPCKQIAHIKYAASRGVRLMAFDNEVELGKVARSHPHARWVPMWDPLEGAEVGAGEVAVGWWRAQRPLKTVVFFCCAGCFWVLLLTAAPLPIPA